MPLDAERLTAPFDKLQKTVRRSKKLSEPERVHKLRTNTRKIEAFLAAFDVLKADQCKDLLQSLKKVRRAAGAVRDMDVLVVKAADVSVADEERDCQIQLLEHLGVQRRKQRRKLTRILKEEGKTVRKHLARAEKHLEPMLQLRSAEERAAEIQAGSRILSATTALQRYPALNRRNLHEFRKQAKQLRYVLQSLKPRDEVFVTALADMQTAIGEWHDWEELHAIAKEVLPHGNQCGLLRELQLHADESFDHALQVANSTRKRFLDARHRRASLQIIARNQPKAA